jgi:hypothetical protein
MRPSELTVTLAVLPGNRAAEFSEDGWVFADDVRSRLRLFGFDVTSQAVAGMLRAMSTCDAPWIESRESAFGMKQYRVTQWGSNDVDNRLPGVRLNAPWLGSST